MHAGESSPLAAGERSDEAHGECATVRFLPVNLSWPSLASSVVYPGVFAGGAFSVSHVQARESMGEGVHLFVGVIARPGGMLDRKELTEA